METESIRNFFSSLTRKPEAFVAVIIFSSFIVLAIFAPYIAPHDPRKGDILNRLKPPMWAERGNKEHILGTDSLGRDVLSRLIVGSRISLLVGIGGVIVAGGIGVFTGLLAGYFGGKLDDVIMRIVDVQLSFPFILLAIAVLMVLGGGVVNVVIVLSLAKWVTFSRVSRGQVLTIREYDFVEAVRASGASESRILFRTILPNLVAPITVIASFTFAEMIIGEAQLSFLGLGVPPSIPTWGGMLSEGKEYIIQAWWLATFPGLAIMLIVLSINIVGDWLRDYLDPKLDLYT